MQTIADNAVIDSRNLIRCMLFLAIYWVVPSIVGK